MLRVHPHLKRPLRDHRIWRYMTWHRFESLLEDKGLFFVRLFYLSKIDPYEGTVTLPMVREFAKGRTPKEIQEFMNGVHVSRKHIAVNCWHASEYESAAMWKQYSGRQGCIAITTHVNRLADSLPIDVYGGMVEYVDYREGKVDLNNIVATAGIKRIEFSHEKEFRAVIFDNKPEWHEMANGFLVPADLDHLIEEVWLHPDATSEFCDLAAATLGKHGLQKPIKRSQILIEPNYLYEVLADLE